MALLLLPTFCLSALAEEPPLPRTRPSEATTETPLVPLPRPRPDAAESQPVDQPAVAPDAPVDVPVDASVPPVAEPTAPPRDYQVACPAVLAGQVDAKALPPISDKQCGIQSPLSLTGVLANGRMVPVSGGVVTDCGMATAMPAWISAIDSYVFARDNTRVSGVVVGTSYMCRNVNNAGEGNLSFHAFADALDVVGFKLEDGRTVTVEGGWADALSADGRLLRFAHDAACSQFTTVLGPEANALHRDHLHVDLGCHGKTCTARLCE